MTTVPYTAKINGSLVNVIAGTLNVQNQIGQRSTGSLSVWSALGVYWQYGTQIQIYDDSGSLAYNGFIVKDKLSKRGARQGYGFIEHKLTIMDNCYKADKRVIFASYLNQSAGSIVQSILGAVLASEGVTATANSIASGPTITEAIWNGKKTSDALAWLATQSGYWWQIDLNNILWFQPYGGIPAPFVIDGTQIDAQQNLSVEYGNDMYVNKQYAKGAYATTAILTETFHGDGVKRGFTLSYGVASTAASDLIITVNSVAQTIGTKGNTGQQWYAAIGDAVLAQDTGQTVLGAGDTLSVTYKGRYPVLAVAQNPALQVAQKAREGSGSGIVESVYANTKVHTLAAAFQIAGSLLSHYGNDTTVLTFDTRVKGLQPGQMLTVILSDFALSNKQMLISSVAIDDQTDGYNIWFHVTAVGSPIEAAQWQTYWQNLMNQSSDPSDLSDTTDTALALLTSTLVTRAPVATITQNKRTGAVCGVSMLCGSWTVC